MHLVLKQFQNIGFPDHPGLRALYSQTNAQIEASKDDENAENQPRKTLKSSF